MSTNENHQLLPIKGAGENDMFVNLKAGAVIVLVGVMAAASNAATIAYWGFEVNTPPDSTDTAAVGPFAPDQGTGEARGVHASSATDWSTPAGNGSVESLSANTWTTGDYFEFRVSTVGFTDIMLSWDQTRSGTGPDTFDLTYSTDGTTFTTFLDNYTVLANASSAGPPATSAWSSGTPRQSAYTFTADLSAIDAIENQADVYFRLVSQVTPAAGGTNRVDNFEVTGVPEPTGVSVLALGAIFASRRRRRA